MEITVVGKEVKIRCAVSPYFGKSPIVLDFSDSEEKHSIRCLCKNWSWHDSGSRVGIVGFIGGLILISGVRCILAEAFKIHWIFLVPSHFWVRPREQQVKLGMTAESNEDGDDKQASNVTVYARYPRTFYSCKLNGGERMGRRLAAELRPTAEEKNWKTCRNRVHRPRKTRVTLLSELSWYRVEINSLFRDRRRIRRRRLPLYTDVFIEGARHYSSPSAATRFAYIIITKWINSKGLHLYLKSIFAFCILVALKLLTEWSRLTPKELLLFTFIYLVVVTIHIQYDYFLEYALTRH